VLVRMGSTSPRLRVDVGIDPYKCAAPQICAKLRADMESAPTFHRKLTAYCRGAHCASVIFPS
jgi:hypothetical protein